MRLPVPWFGFKGSVAELVWAKFGDVPNFVSPFVGAGGVLFRRPSWHLRLVETINDLHGELANAYRALKWCPDAVALAADWPVSEVDIQARWRWSKRRVREWARTHGGLSLRAWLEADPMHCDPQLAGFWLWGQSVTIGNAWDRVSEQRRTPRLQGRAGTTACGVGVQARRLTGSVGGGKGKKGQGVAAETLGVSQRISATALSGPMGTGVSLGRGVQAGPVAGRSGSRLANLTAYFHALADRLERVRIMCGDFDRALRPSVTTQHGLTAIFLDPEYSNHENKYASKGGEQQGVFSRCAARSIEIVNGDLRSGEVRLALCGYDGDFDVPAPVTPSKGRFKGQTLRWETVAWKSSGYARSEQGLENERRERIWFSPHCLPATSLSRCVRKSSERDLSAADPRQLSLA